MASSFFALFDDIATVLDDVAVMTKVGAYATLRFGTLVFPESVPATGALVADLLLPAALATLVLGAIGVLGATSLLGERLIPQLVAGGYRVCAFSRAAQPRDAGAVS